MNKVKLNLAFLRNFKKDYRVFLDKLIKENGTAFVASGKFGNLHFFGDPQWMEHVLFEKHKVYARPQNRIVDEVLRDSAMKLPEDQEQWRTERFNVLNPILKEQHVLLYADKMINNIEEHLKTWEPLAKTHEAVSIHDLIASMAIQNLCMLMFDNVKVNEHELSFAIREFFYLFISYDMSITKLAWKFPTELKRRTKAVTTTLHRLCDDIVNYCLSDKATDENFVHTLAKKYLPNYPNLTKEDKTHLAGRVAVFLIGGFDNITGNFIWILIYLSWYPLMAQKIREEVKAKIGSQKLTAQDLDLLTFTRATFMESLRLTAGAFLPRVAMEDDQFGDYFVKKNDRILLELFYLHRSPIYWENPEGFDPNRFLKPLGDIYRFIYLPFSTGPRGCIGRDFAMVQTTILLATVIPKYNIHLTPFQVVDPNFQYLDPKRSKPIMVTIHPT